MGIENKIDKEEVILSKAKSHVQIYQIQKNWARKVISIVRVGITHHLPSLFCLKVVPIDMGLKLCLANF